MDRQIRSSLRNVRTKHMGGFTKPSTSSGIPWNGQCATRQSVYFCCRDMHKLHESKVFKCIVYKAYENSGFGGEQRCLIKVKQNPRAEVQASNFGIEIS